MIIVGNLKMNLSFEEIRRYEQAIRGYDVIICPSFLYLTLFNQGRYQACAQNISAFDNGPYTGEVSANQLKSMGVNYVLIGHSERRHVFNESQEEINKKIKQALNNKLKIIYCVGETRAEMDNNESFDVIQNQLVAAFDQINKEEMTNIIIGYEPVWAISDGIHPNVAPQNNQIEKINNYINETIRNKYGVEVPLLYGGSVNLNNIENLLLIKSCQGFLIGGASKNLEEFIKIMEICK